MSQAKDRTMADKDAQAILAELEALCEKLTNVKKAISHAVHGQETTIAQTLATILGGGHVLLVGLPGLGKTLLVETLGIVLGLETKRIQCTPDLMPADILGSEVIEESTAGKRRFRFIPGPVFCQCLMADEINRASPRTQSALLQAMQEHSVSVAGTTHSLPKPFHVLATQNPIEQEGTYPLPEAQLDRFLMEIRVPYPDAETENKIIIETTGPEKTDPQNVINAEELIAAQRLIRRMPVGQKIVNGIVELTRELRPQSSRFADIRDHVAWGPGPRAGQAFMAATRARAALEGRLSPSLDDVAALTGPVLRHRMALHFAARAENIGLESLINDIQARVL